MCSLKRESALWFLNQHCNGVTHLKNLAKHQAGSVEADLEPSLECQGLALDHESCGPLFLLADDVRQWVAWQGPSSLRQHHYQFTTDSSSLLLRHDACQRTTSHLELGRPVCGECAKLMHKDGIRRLVVRNAVKKHAAEELYARLFEPSDRMTELAQKRKASAL